MDHSAKWLVDCGVTKTAERGRAEATERDFCSRIEGRSGRWCSSPEIDPDSDDPTGTKRNMLARVSSLV